ncbi:hypothetical protein [Argonema galeatum]|nr:hypothetical protein [Argonema galeatum]
MLVQLESAIDARGWMWVRSPFWDVGAGLYESAIALFGMFVLVG